MSLVRSQLNHIDTNWLKKEHTFLLAEVFLRARKFMDLREISRQAIRGGACWRDIYKKGGEGKKNVRFVRGKVNLYVACSISHVYESTCRSRVEAERRGHSRSLNSLWRLERRETARSPAISLCSNSRTVNRHYRDDTTPDTASKRLHVTLAFDVKAAFIRDIQFQALEDKIYLIEGSVLRWYAVRPMILCHLVQIINNRD